MLGTDKVFQPAFEHLNSDQSIFSIDEGHLSNACPDISHLSADPIPPFHPSDATVNHFADQQRSSAIASFSEAFQCLPDMNPVNHYASYWSPDSETATNASSSSPLWLSAAPPARTQTHKDSHEQSPHKLAPDASHPDADLQILQELARYCSMLHTMHLA